MQVSHTFIAGSAVFDEDNLVSCAGLVPVMALAEQAGLTRLLDNNIHITSTRVKSGAANPAPKLATLIAGMCAGADYIDDVDLVRAGGMKTLFDQVYAPSTVGTLLREFTFGHARQLDSVLTQHLAGLCQRVNLLPGAEVRAFVDIDSLLRPVHGHAKRATRCRTFRVSYVIGGRQCCHVAPGWCSIVRLPPRRASQAPGLWGAKPEESVPKAP